MSSSRQVDSRAAVSTVSVGIAAAVAAVVAALGSDAAAASVAPGEPPAAAPGGPVAVAAEPSPVATDVFLQFGAGTGQSRAAGAGIVLPWRWQRPIGGSLLTANTELAIGHWTNGGRGDALERSTRIGATPSLRWWPAGRTAGRGAFVEAGIGVNWIAPLWRNDTRRFSTRFNFGEHLAVGWRFGERGRHELSLRIQHFSNASIRQPNPGENFVQLRWAVALD